MKKRKIFARFVPRSVKNVVLNVVNIKPNIARNVPTCAGNAQKNAGECNKNIKRYNLYVIAFYLQLSISVVLLMGKMISNKLMNQPHKYQYWNGQQQDRKLGGKLQLFHLNGFVPVSEFH